MKKFNLKKIKPGSLFQSVLEPSRIFFVAQTTKCLPVPCKDVVMYLGVVDKNEIIELNKTRSDTELCFGEDVATYAFLYKNQILWLQDHLMNTFSYLFKQIY